MLELTLESEFEIYKQIHKTTILQAKITTHFKDLQNTGIKIPEFMTIPAEKLAEKEVVNLICNSPKLFNTLYENAWREYAEYLP